MNLDILTPGQRALLEVLTGATADELRRVWALPDAELNEMAARRVRQREIENAIKDFQTVALGTEVIEPKEDWIRLELLRLLQSMPARQLYVATYETDKTFEGLARTADARDAPWFVLLRYLRASRSLRSLTENSRDCFTSFPTEPPEACRRLLVQVVEKLRNRGPRKP